MKAVNNILLAILVTTIAIHLFGVHSKLLFHLNPDKIRNVTGTVEPFSFLDVNENNITAIFFGWCYSIATAIILVLSFKSIKLLVTIVAIFGAMDGFGVFIYYNIENFDKSYLLLFGGLYYGVYTFLIIISAGYYRIKRVNISDEPENNIIQQPVSSNIIEKPKYHNNITRNISDEDRVKWDNITRDIKELNEKGYKQVDIAKSLNCSQSLVSKILKAERELITNN